MSRRSDDRLVAYLDGEVEASERRDIEAWLDSDPAARGKLAALAQSAELLREAFGEVLREPLPDRLIAAARGAKGTICPPLCAAVAPRAAAISWSGNGSRSTSSNALRSNSAEWASPASLSRAVGSLSSHASISRLSAASTSPSR